MATLSKPTQLWGVFMGLVGLQFAAMVLFVEHDVYQYIVPYAETNQQQLGVLAGLVLGGVGIARYGYGRPNRLIQGIGTLLVITAYGLSIPYLSRSGVIDRPFVVIELLGVSTLIVISLLYWYATRSSTQFRTWDARATVVFLSAVMLTVAGWFVTPVLAGAAIVGFFPLMMHLFHVIGFVQDGTIELFRHGMRLYIATFGFFVELALYFISALKRLR